MPRTPNVRRSPRTPPYEFFRDLRPSTSAGPAPAPHHGFQPPAAVRQPQLYHDFDPLADPLPALQPQPLRDLGPAIGPWIAPPRQPLHDFIPGPEPQPQASPNFDPLAGPLPFPALQPEPLPDLSPNIGPLLEPPRQPCHDSRPPVGPEPAPPPQASPDFDPLVGPAREPQHEIFPGFDPWADPKQAPGPAREPQHEIFPGFDPWADPEQASESHASVLLGPLVSLPTLVDFENFDLEHARELIQRDDLDASTEEIYHYVMRWLSKDRSRHIHLLELLLDVRLIFLSYRFLQDCVKTNPLVRADERCESELTAAMEYHLIIVDQQRDIRNERKFPTRWRRMIIGREQRITEAAVFQGSRCQRRRKIRPACPKLVYLVGSEENSGEGSNQSAGLSVEFFDPQRKTSVPVENFPDERRNFAVAAFGNKIYVAGGFSGRGYLSTVYFYDPLSRDDRKWKEGPKMGIVRAQLGLIEYRGRLHAIGGVTSRQDETLGSNRHTNTTEVLVSRESEEWRPGTPMQVARADMGVAVARKRLYVLGGQYHSDSCGMEYFCSENDAWVQVNDKLPEVNEYRRLFVSDDKIHIIGHRLNKTYSKCCLAYSDVLEKWNPVKVRGKCIFFDSAVALVDGIVYFLGGSVQARSSHDDISMWDIENNVWDKKYAKCNNARAQSKAAIIDDHRRPVAQSGEI